MDDAGAILPAGGLGEVVIRGRNGQFVALDARDGKLLWETNLGPSVSAGPMSYSVNGKQYVSIQGGTALYTFALR